MFFLFARFPTLAFTDVQRDSLTQLEGWRAGGMDFLGAARGCELVAAGPAPPALLVTFNATRVKIPDTE